MTRRDLLYTTAATFLSFTKMAKGDSMPKSKMGIATTSYMTVLRPRDTFQFLEHCHALGAAGIQSVINGDLPRIRAQAEQWGMFIEAMVPLPKGRDDTAALENSLRNAQAVGATCARAVSLGSRRYETFHTYADYEAWVKRSNAGLEAAVPLFEKYKMPVGLENHKDRTVDQLVAVLKRFSSEYLGSCLDFGNNIALLDNPVDVIEKLTPYVITTHVKNMGVESYPDGFLLSEVLLGDGFLDLPPIVAGIHRAKPKAHFLLEMITRDPLKVPCLLDEYWVTFPDRNGRYLADSLKFVQKHSDPAKPLPRISQLPHEEQLRIEEANVKTCLEYAQRFDI